jgi:hypothetical protein
VVKVFAKKEEDNNLTTTITLPSEPIRQIDDSEILEKLISEEAKLLDDKQNWATLKDSLEKKAKDEIELRKSSILKLKSEITDLKVSCETLTKSLNTGVQTQ